jgi:hypothetical protein
VSTADPLRLRSYADIVRNPLPPVEYDVDRLIPRGARVLLYGEPSGGKTWLALSLGLALGAGQKWAGEFAVPAPRRVLYVDEEMPPQILESRIWRLGRGGENAETVSFKWLSRPGLLFTSGGVSRLLSSCEAGEFDPEVVIVDSVRRVLCGSENDAEAVANFWRTTRPICTTRTFIVIHHMKKPNPQGGNDARYRASGSTDLIAGVDVAFAVTRKQGDAMLVECVKARHAVEPEPFIVSLYDESDNKPIVLRYDGSPSEARAEATAVGRAAEFIVRFLSERPDRKAPTAELNAYLSAQGVREKTAERARASLKNTGKIEQSESRRGCWRLVVKEAGVAA